MRIKMLKNAHGADDGKTVTEYHAHNEYDVSDSLAKCFLDTGAAQAISSEANAVEQKALTEESYENKARFTKKQK